MSVVEIRTTVGNFNLDAYFGFQFCWVMPKVLRDIIETFLRPSKLVFDYQYDTVEHHQMTTPSACCYPPFGVIFEFEIRYETINPRIYFHLSNDKNNFLIDERPKTLVCGLNRNNLFISNTNSTDRVDKYIINEFDAIRQVGEKLTIEFGIGANGDQRHLKNVFMRLYIQSPNKQTCQKCEIEFQDPDLLKQRPLYFKCQYTTSLKLTRGSLLAPTHFPPNQQHF